MKIYLRLISICYLVASLMHLADIFDLRLQYSEMNATWKIWIWSLLIADAIATVGLWKEKTWGQLTFLIIAGAQLIAYRFFQNIFGPQTFLIFFHSITVIIYLLLFANKRIKQQI